MKVQKISMRASLANPFVGLIMIGLVLASSLFVSGVLQPHTIGRGFQYSSASEIPIDSQAVLIGFAKRLNLTGLGRLRVQLVGYQNFATPNGTQDPLGDYIKTVSEVIDDMQQMNVTLRSTKGFIDSGQTDQALAGLSSLRSLRNETRILLSTSQQLLLEVADKYEIDTTAQQTQLNELQTQFQDMSAQINQLATRIKPQQGVQTFLSLNASKQQVFIGETFFLNGLLTTQNTTALPERNVTLDWGAGSSVTETTDRVGRFNVSLTLPIGFPGGFVDIQAKFNPQGSDSKEYQPSAAVVVVVASYEPTLIRAQLSQGTVKPLDYASVTGTLSTIRGTLIPNRTMVLQLDGVFLGNALTDSSGAFNFQFTVSPSLSNGTHLVQISFPATNERFAPANATLPLVVERLTTQLALSLDRTALFSGMTLSLNGTATYENGTLPANGNVTISLDGIPYENATLSNTGSFNSTIQLQPWLSFGSHTIQVDYIPNQPQLTGSQTTQRIFVYSTPGIIGTVAIVMAIGSITVLVSKRRRRAVVLTTTAESTMAPEPLPKFTPEDLTASIRDEATPSARIRKAYQLAQSIIDRKESWTPSPDSQTHWEYFARATQAFPTIEDPLRRLVELFELAEYSEFQMGATQTREATEALLEIRKQIGPVK